MSGFMEGDYSAADVQRFVDGAIEDERADSGKEIEDMRQQLQATEARCADLQARCERLTSVMDEVARALHAHNRPAMAGRVRIECRDKLEAALDQDRAALQHTTAETGDE